MHGYPMIDLNVGVKDGACEGMWALNLNGDSSTYRRLPIVNYWLSPHVSSLSVNAELDISVTTGKLSMPILVCSNDIPYSSHTFTVSIASTDPAADPMLTVDVTEITLSSEVLCGWVIIDATNAAALVDRTAILSISPSSSDMLYSGSSEIVTVVAASTSTWESTWTVTDPTTNGVTIRGSTNLAGVYFIYLAPENIYDESKANWGNLSELYTGV